MRFVREREWGLLGLVGLEDPETGYGNGCVVYGAGLGDEAGSMIPARRC